ncbi:hypothetical protein NitYY0918_C1473 [Nitratiruptor sp. YY09-18]|nr:hypothetical protein NitYY0918_C1473 [Nitratiruptor sp. YY09-18]
MLITFIILLLFFGCAQKEYIQRDLRLEHGYNYLNHYRQALGMIPLHKNLTLEKAATAHAHYLAFHHTTGHTESRSKSGFSGLHAGDRAVRFGYSTYDVIENIAYGKDVSTSIDMLFATLYHRLGFMDWSIDEVGIGYDSKGITVVDMGRSLVRQACESAYARIGKVYTNICKKPLAVSRYQRAIAMNQKLNPPIIYWPTKQISVVPYAYPESPNPYRYLLEGYPITIRFNPFYFSQRPKIIVFQLKDHNGKKIRLLQQIDRTNDRMHIFSSYDFAYIPEALEWGKMYRASLIYSYRGQIRSLTWSFSTKKPTKNFIVLKKKVIKIKPNRWYELYWQPCSPTDKITTYRYYCPKNVNIKGYMKGINTIAIRIEGKPGQRVKLVLSNGKRIILQLN